MTTYTPPTDQNYSRDLHQGNGHREIHVSPLIDVPHAAEPQKASRPSLKPSLYIYDIATLRPQLAELRASKARRLEEMEDPNSQLTRAFLSSMIGADSKLLDQLDTLTQKGETRFISKEPIEKISPDSYAYEVKTLRTVFEAAHNYAHQRALEARSAGSCFLGAYEVSLKEAAMDHVTALNSREAGHRFLETPVQIESTLVNTSTGKSYNAWALQTLTKLRESGQARPAQFNI